MKIDDKRAAELVALEARAFTGPWRYDKFYIDCDECGEETLAVMEVQAPEQYPADDECPQCVTQQTFGIDVPGLGQLANANGALIVAARNALADLLADRAELLELLSLVSTETRWHQGNSGKNLISIETRARIDGLLASCGRKP